MKFTLTTRAKADLRAIAKFTEKRWGKKQRNLYVKQFDNTFRELAAQPLIGKNCDYIRENYRKFPQGSHLIFYIQFGAKEIRVIRILHNRTDFEARLTASSPPKSK